jgi:hypothetical protein
LETVESDVNPEQQGVIIGSNADAASGHVARPAKLNASVSSASLHDGEELAAERA